MQASCEAQVPPKDPGLTTVLQYQSETDAIREAREPLTTRLTVWVLAALIASCIAVTFFVWVDRVVTSASGRIVSTEPVDVFQALDPSIIKSIDVKEGEEVAGGQLLATLDQTFAAADVDQLKLQIASLDAQIARAEAELAGRPPLFLQNEDADHARYAALQKALYDERTASFKAQESSFDAKIAQTESTITKLENDESRYTEREKIAKQIQDMRSTLLERQAGSLLNFLSSSDTRLELLRTLENGHNSLLESRHLLESLGSDRDASGSNGSQRPPRSSSRRATRATRRSPRWSRRPSTKDLVRLIAPEPAIVLTMAKLSVGSVLKEGDELMTLMRLRTPLEAEVNILSRDIGFVRTGDPATLKIDAFNFFEYGSAEGRIRWISEGAFTTDNDGKEVEAYYKARISIDATHFVGVPANFRLIPGMTLTADATVGRHSLFRYLLGGALHGAGEAMREP